MATVTSNNVLNIDTTQSTSSNLPTTLNDNRKRTITSRFANGTTADKIDLRYEKTLTFVASTPQTLDLTALADPVYGTINMARVREIILVLRSTTDAATLTLSPNASNGWTSLVGASSTLKLQASAASGSVNSAFLHVGAPNTTGMVTGGSNKALDLTPSAHAFSADVTILGCSV